MRRVIQETRRRQRKCGTKNVSLGILSKASTKHSVSIGRSRRFIRPADHSIRYMSTSAASTASSWIKDVLRTKSLNPPNPILKSLPSTQLVLDALSQSPDHIQTTITHLPDFSILQPHHLVKAAQEIQRQYDVDLAQLEVRLTSVSEETDSGHPSDPSLSSLLLDMDHLTAPLIQMKEISDLYTTLASPPDQIHHWLEVAETNAHDIRRFLENFHGSKILYRALLAASNSSKVSRSILVPFCKRGSHIPDDVDRVDTSHHDTETYQEIQSELTTLNDRLGNLVSYDRASKAMRLQCMSDMYNCIGLSRMQAEMLSTDSVWELSRLQHNHMVVSPKEELLHGLFPEIVSFLEPFLPKQAKLDLEGVGAFLDSKSEAANNLASNATQTEQQKVMKAKYDFKQRIRMHGVLQGLIDFCDGILGITAVEESGAANVDAGWNKNVRLLHLFEKNGVKEANDVERGTGDTDIAKNGRYLGTIYLDPFADSYWRTEDAKEMVTTRLFSRQLTGQTVAPVAIVALNITPIWDDTPVPMTWKETREFLFQFGKAVQLILTQSCQREYRHKHNTILHPFPIDCSEILGHFLEMWVHNDGFLQRLAQLSQDESMIEEETIETLRNDLRSEKALEIANTIFLSALQFTVFDEFDPRGDETLVSLQERLANQYLPNSNLPDPSDLSPLLAIFQESGSDQNMSAYAPLWSQLIAATLYETFQRTDLRDEDAVAKLGTGIRDLFLTKSGDDSTVTKHHMSGNDLEFLTTPSISSQPLKRVHLFHET